MRPSPSRSLVALLAACWCALGSKVSAQYAFDLDIGVDFITFKAPIFLGSVASPPSSPLPIAGLHATLDGTETGTSQPLSAAGYTDATGTFAMPPDFHSGQLSFAGLWLGNPNVVVGRYTQQLTAPLPPVAGVPLLCSLLTPTPTISFFPGGAPAWSLSEINAFRHVNVATQRLRNVLGHVQFPSPVQEFVVIVSPLTSDSFGSRASYQPATDAIWIYAGSPNPELATHGRSFSVMAHECAHRYVHAIYGGPPPAGLDEGFADFLAYVVTGTPVIGAGLQGALMPRDISRGLVGVSTDPHVAGLRLANALYVTKLSYAGGPLGRFTNLLRPLLDLRPANAASVLDFLLLLDDDDSTLANGTPNDIAIWRGFTESAGYPWPAGVPVP